MKKSIIKIALILSGVFMLGCDNFLDPDIDNTYVEEDVLQRAKYAEGILLNAYSSLPDGLALNDVASDDAVSNQTTGGSGNFRKAATGEWSASFNPFSQWSYYTAIGYLNFFLDEIVNQTMWSPTDSLKQVNFRRRLKGEAHGLRAYYYSQLLKSHAGIGASSGTLLGVPMVLSSDRTILPRASFDECISQILSDIQFAVDSLPDLYVEAPVNDLGKADMDAVYGPNFKNRMCGRIAKMIKARVLLQAASPAFNPTDDPDKWAAAADAAANVIDAFGGVSALAATRLDFYLNTNSSDHLWRRDIANIRGWEVSNFPPSQNGNGATNPSQNLIDAFPGANGYPISISTSGYNEVSPYTNRDPRLTKWIIRNGTTFKGVAIYTIDGPIDGIGKASERSTRSGYYLLKHMNPNVSLVSGSEVNQQHAVNLMRYTEAYLIYAEAANRAWGPDGKGSHDYSARDIISRLRSTAGITDSDPYLASLTSKSDFEMLVRNERRLELCFENSRFWDIRRWRDLTTMKAEVKGTDGVTSFVVEHRPFSDYMIYGPIPADEVRKGLEQNKGW
ncbi:RagB/SusD family nutrient uptake outer membrane protein [Dysgonomonas reticulitermitis]